MTIDAMLRKIEVLVDSSSWENAEVPKEIAQMKGFWKASVLSALIHTALWTRPPINYGFHLSDLWAWFRYYRAIDSSSRLKLCKEWEDVDPHQKSVLSDELGVGFTTYLLFDKLNCLFFVDTLYLAKKFPTAFKLKTSKKVGSRKSPDYIGFTSDLDYYVLECKGTQTSRKVLEKALNNGRNQKNNLDNVTGSGMKLKYSLVAGLFISPHSHREQSCIRVADPTWNDIENFLSSHSRDRVNDAIIQLALAKHFSLAGLINLSRKLAESSSDEIEISRAVRQEIDNWLEMPSDSEGFRIIFNQSSAYTSRNIDSQQFLGIRFLVVTPDDLLREILVGRVPVEMLLRERYRNYRRPYLDIPSTYNEVQSLGFKFKLDEGNFNGFST